LRFEEMEYFKKRFKKNERDISYYYPFGKIIMYFDGMILELKK